VAAISPKINWPGAVTFAALAYLSIGIWPSTYGVAAIVVVPFSVLIVAAAQRDLDGRQGWLTRRVAIYLGEASYCFYLVHHIFVSRFAQPGFRALGIDGIFGFVLALVLALVAAWGLHKFVEMHFYHKLKGQHPKPAPDPSRTLIEDSVPLDRP
jgi:peptidoglycan/LPS O-acetylase OafA/YrhL